MDKLTQILYTYRQILSGRICEMETNYTDLLQFRIYFDDTHLPHLLGLHKLNSEYSGKRCIELIDDERLVMKKLYKYRQFSQIRDRIYDFDYFFNMLVRGDIKFCIVRKDIKRNTMNLDIVLFSGEIERAYVIGLKRDRKHSTVFYPATFYKCSSSKTEEYFMSRRTNIVSIKFL